MKLISVYMPNIVNNPYSENIRRLLNLVEIETYSIKKIFGSPRLFFACKIVNLNWFENIASLKEYYVKRILLQVFKRSHIKIIYTFHNKKPHNNKFEKHSAKIMQLLCKLSDSIIGLCPDTLKYVEEIVPEAGNKVRIIPHPNYISNYSNSDNDYKKEYNISSNDIVLMFFGSLSKYKNIEMLIDVFQNIDAKDIKLLIVGGSNSADYKNQLLNRTNGSESIIADFRFVPENEIVNLYNTADIIVLPYNDETTLNSGAMYLSFSLKKTVICPDIGSVNALWDKSFVYTYSYANAKDHAEKLKGCINAVLNDIKHDSNVLQKKGIRAFEYVKEYHSDERIAGLYKELYLQLLK